MVWSYGVICSECGGSFDIWDACRSYGRTVREHRILSEFPCPNCKAQLRKRLLERSTAAPVLLGYRCCGSRSIPREHPLDEQDRERVRDLAASPPLVPGYYPRTELPDGVNLRQPKKHGLRRVDDFYTPRNLAALSHIWQRLHKVRDLALATQLAFVFTSLYQRVTKLSEFRFWGGSGNTARFNVPFIFNEANVFQTFERKAASIRDHLASTARHFHGRVLVANGSATALNFLPDSSVDLVFTDPPFGGNINYSEMNFLWESWLGVFTANSEEAIMNRVQGKGVGEYGELMRRSLLECYRVLKPGHWMLLVFMNSSARVWDALRNAILEAGFDIVKADVFDKQHSTVKQLVTDNTAGADLVLHCRKSRPSRARAVLPLRSTPEVRDSIAAFLQRHDVGARTNVYLHVGREEELDIRSLYSEWLATVLVRGQKTIDYPTFRRTVSEILPA